MALFLAQRVLEDRSRYLRHNDLLVYSLIVLEVSASARVHIHPVSVGEGVDVRQGIAVGTTDRKLELQSNQIESRSFVFWHEDRDRESIVQFAKRSDEILRMTLWNVWLGPQDSIRAWTGNAGILVSGDASCFTMRCSSGLGPIDFSNQVVEVEVEASHARLASAEDESSSES